jgi:Polyketide cyclase / dehydrase and lipid transport
MCHQETTMKFQDYRGMTEDAARKCTNIAVGALCALAILHASDAPAASLSRSAVVNAPADQVWTQIGPFCAIKNWHPAIASCRIAGGHRPVRTLITKDGTTVFVEPQIARNEAERFYSYSFQSSPFPVTHYMGTIWVVPNDSGTSTVLWTGTFTSLPGREKEAEADFAAVYDAGLAALKAKFAH